MNQSTRPAQKVHLAFDDLSRVRTGEATPSSAQRVQVRRQRQERQAAQRRELMLDAALALFQETGLQGFNMRELGLRAGYTPGALYAYFDGKAAILQALRDRLLNQLTVDLQQSVPRRRPNARTAGDQIDADASSFLLLSRVWWRWLAQDTLRLHLLLAVDLPVTAPLSGARSQPEPGASVMPDAPSLLQQLIRATMPCKEALHTMGLSAERADDLHVHSIVWGIGLLVLHGQQAGSPVLGEHFLEGLRQQLMTAPPMSVSSAPDDTQRPQGDLFGG